MAITRLLLAFSLLVFASASQAFTWTDLWLTPEQQAAHLLAKGKPVEAISLFKDRQWQAVAHYRAGHYRQALQLFKQANQANDWYNRGNALARLGRYTPAIKAYDQALKLAPEHADAKFNRNVVRKLAKRKPQKHKQRQRHPDKNQQPSSHTKQSASQPLSEKQLAQKQWLRRVPDNPSSLLRNKFFRDYWRRHKG